MVKKFYKGTEILKKTPNTRYKVFIKIGKKKDRGKL